MRRRGRGSDGAEVSRWTLYGYHRQFAIDRLDSIGSRKIRPHDEFHGIARFRSLKNRLRLLLIAFRPVDSCSQAVANNISRRQNTPRPLKSQRNAHTGCHQYSQKTVRRTRLAQRTQPAKESRLCCRVHPMHSVKVRRCECRRSLLTRYRRAISCILVAPASPVCIATMPQIHSTQYIGQTYLYPDYSFRMIGRLILVSDHGLCTFATLYLVVPFRAPTLILD